MSRASDYVVQITEATKTRPPDFVDPREGSSEPGPRLTLTLTTTGGCLIATSTGSFATVVPAEVMLAVEEWIRATFR